MPKKTSTQAASQNVVDSSGWIEFFSGGPHKDFFSTVVRETPRLVVPTVILYEVQRYLVRAIGERQAVTLIAVMRHAHVADLTADIAMESARLSLLHHLPMADAIILATARAHNAVLWSLDKDFSGIKGVRLPA